MKWINSLLIVGLVSGFKCRSKSSSLSSSLPSSTHLPKCTHKPSVTSSMVSSSVTSSSAPTSSLSSSSVSVSSSGASLTTSQMSSSNGVSSTMKNPSYSASSTMVNIPSNSASSSIVSQSPSITLSSSIASSSLSSAPVSTSHTSASSQSSQYPSSSSSSSIAVIPSQAPGSCQTNLYGITFSPYDTTGLCLSSNAVYQQLLQVSKLTTNIRTYGTDCNQLPNILDALVKIKAETGVHVNIMLGLWTRGGETRTQKEQQDLVKALANPRYCDFISSVTSGNEERFNGVSSDEIIKNINNVKSVLRENNINRPVATAETYKMFDKSLVGASDFIPVSIYPFYTSTYGNGTVTAAVEGAIKELLALKTSLPPNKQIIVSETGWPTSGTAARSFGSPSLANQREYIALFQCMASKNGIPTYFLEAFNAGWKSGDTAEKFFGLLDNNGQFNGGHLTSICC